MLQSSAYLTNRNPRRPSSVSSSSSPLGQPPRPAVPCAPCPSPRRPEQKKWFEEAHPANKNKIISGQLNAPGKSDIRLAIAAEAVKIAPNIDVNVYNVYLEVVPAANPTYQRKFASSASKSFVKGWGLKIG